MKFKNLVIALLVLLFSAGASSETNAQEWRDYRYCKSHGCSDCSHYRGRYYYRFLRRGCNFGYRRDYYGYNAKIDSTFKDWDAKYYHTVKDEQRNDDGYYRYYHHYNRYYYDHYYDNNFRPQVDDNK